VLVRGVGVTGYPLPALLHVARLGPVDTVMSYCHHTVQDRRLGAVAAEFAAAGVALINASPLAMGALTDQGAPPWHPAPAQMLNRCAKAAARCRERGSSGEARAAILGHDKSVRHDCCRQRQSGPREA
jgi:L-galactose dehydrogenase